MIIWLIFELTLCWCILNSYISNNRADLGLYWCSINKDWGLWHTILWINKIFKYGIHYDKLVRILWRLKQTKYWSSIHWVYIYKNAWWYCDWRVKVTVNICCHIRVKKSWKNRTLNLWRLLRNINLTPNIIIKNWKVSYISNCNIWQCSKKTGQIEISYITSRITYYRIL